MTRTAAARPGTGAPAEVPHPTREQRVASGIEMR